MDELGITAGLNCFTKGDMGGCVETLANIASAMVGCLVGKILARYGTPWKWAKAARLGKRLWTLGDELIGGVKDFFKARKELKAARRALEECNSFTPGTKVLMADGSHKPIEDVKIGDKLLATDPNTGETQAKEVIATIIGNGKKNLVEITDRFCRES